MSAVDTRYSVPETAVDLARRATFGIGVAVVALLVVQGLVEWSGVEVRTGGPTSPFAVGALVGTTIVAGAAAAVV